MNIHMNARILRFLIMVTGFVCLCVSATIAQAMDARWETYTNVYFGYSISYPANLLAPQGEAANRDGQTFLSPDGAARMLVYSQYNAFELSLFQEYQNALGDSNRTVTYDVLKDDWFVLSGYEGGNIYYRKTMFRDDIFYTFDIVYPKEQDGLYSPLIKSIVESFVLL